VGFAVDIVELEQAFLYVLRLSPVGCCSIIFLFFINVISWAPVTGPLAGAVPGDSDSIPGLKIKTYDEFG